MRQVPGIHSQEGLESTGHGFQTVTVTWEGSRRENTKFCTWLGFLRIRPYMAICQRQKINVDSPRDPGMLLTTRASCELPTKKWRGTQFCHVCLSPGPYSVSTCCSSVLPLEGTHEPDYLPCPALVWPPWDSIPTIPGVGQVGALRFSELSPCLVPCALDLIPNTLSAQDTGPTLPLGPSAVKVLRAAANTNSLASSK